MLMVSPGFLRAPPKQSRVLVSSVSPGRNAATGSAGPKIPLTLSAVARKVTTLGAGLATGTGLDGGFRSWPKAKGESTAEQKSTPSPAFNCIEGGVYHSYSSRQNPRGSDATTRADG